MPWKERYTISDEKSLSDSEVTLAGRQALLLPRRRRPQPGLRARRHHARRTSTTPDAYFGMHGGLGGAA